MKAFVPRLAGALLVLTVAACADSPTAPTNRAAQPMAGADAASLCVPGFDPCADAPSPVQVLVDALTARINALRVPANVKATLTAYVQQIPTQIARLTPEQRLQSLRAVRGLIGFVQFLTPRFIPAADASDIIGLANQLIAALS